MTKRKDIPTGPILAYLADRQGEWTGLWYGYFKDKYKAACMGPDEEYTDVYYAMPEGTPKRRALAKMRLLHYMGLVGGCPCGCRGDFEITDKGLALIGRLRVKEYNGY